MVAILCSPKIVRTKVRTYLRSNGKNNDNGKSEIRGFFPFDYAQGQNDKVWR
jgi:hypothetical protein